jgi:signal transduction histidine kinase
MVVRDQHADGLTAHESLVAGHRVQTGPPSRLGGAISARTFTAINTALAVACVVVAVAASSADDWRPVGLVLVLFAYTVVAEFGAVAFSAGVEVTVSNFGVALGIAFLGPAPALVIAVVPLALESIHRRIPPAGVAGNVAVYAVLAVAGSLGVGAWLGHPPDVSPRTLLFVVAGLALVAEYVTHLYVGLLQAVILHQSMRRTFRQTLWPLVPFHLVSAALTGAAAVVYVSAGLAALTVLLVALLVSARLIRTAAVADVRRQQVADLAVARARLLGEALTAEERERVRLASEIHDDALQQLAVARLELRGGSVDQAQQSLDAADAALRGTLARVVPAAEALGGGLSVGLERVAADLCDSAALAWTVRVDPALDGEDPTLVVSIARELVTNAVKHAAASRVEVSAEPTSAGVRLEVRDDGRGFAGSQAAERGHFGLALVENRARATGGGLDIRPAAGGGSVVAVELARP